MGAASRRLTTRIGIVAVLAAISVVALVAWRSATGESDAGSCVAAPGAEEKISYGIPTLVLDGRMLLSYGAAAKHCSFYPGALVGTFTAELKDYSTSKGTIRFPIGSTLPPQLVRKIVKACVARNAEKAAKRKTR